MPIFYFSNINSGNIFHLIDNRMGFEKIWLLENVGGKCYSLHITSKINFNFFQSCTLKKNQLGPSEIYPRFKLKPQCSSNAGIVMQNLQKITEPDTKYEQSNLYKTNLTETNN